MNFNNAHRRTNSGKLFVGVGRTIIEVQLAGDTIGCTTIPLVIVVSAWDVAEKKYSTPEDCLVARTPLLWQYLKANNDVFAVSYFGVSAQGGAFESEAAVNELYNQFEDCPAERIIVVDNTGKRSHDITLPLWEAMN